MKMELQINGKIIVIESEGAVTVRVSDIVQSVPVLTPEIFPDTVPAPVNSFAPVASSSCNDLFSKLSDLRKELAVAAKVPAYAIFQDKTLHEMVEKMPHDLQAFSLIGGVGQAKLEKYGEKFLAIIREAAA